MNPCVSIVGQTLTMATYSNGCVPGNTRSKTMIPSWKSGHGVMVGARKNDCASRAWCLCNLCKAHSMNSVQIVAVDGR